MLLSESYKSRLQQLAGIKPIAEAMDANSKKAAMDKSSNRVSYNSAMLQQAIEQGREIGINFQSNNENYKMPVAKARIIWPVYFGKNKNNEDVVRGYHVTGQSEKEARKTKTRSAEIENEWRLFKIKNIKTMWFTDNFFSEPPPGYEGTDKAISSPIAKFDSSKAKEYQASINK
jgi:hypothetical protein